MASDTISLAQYGRVLARGALADTVRCHIERRLQAVPDGEALRVDLCHSADHNPRVDTISDAFLEAVFSPLLISLAYGSFGDRTLEIVGGSAAMTEQLRQIGETSGAATHASPR